jgi:hypothetical protein
MKRGWLLFGFLIVFLSTIRFVSALSLSELAQNEWINAALLFLLVFAVCSFSLQQVFKRSPGTSFVVSLVLALGGSMGTIYYLGPIIPKLAWWVLCLFILAIIGLLWWQFRNRGIIFFIILSAVSLIWLLLGRAQLCYPTGFFPHNVCVILDAAAIAIVFIVFIKLLIELVKWLMGKKSEERETETREVRLIIESTRGGTTNPSPNVYTHTKGDIITIMAIPETYEFKYWIINRRKVFGTTQTLKMRRTVHAKAFFAEEGPVPGPEGPGPKPMGKVILNISKRGYGKTVPRSGFKPYEFRRGTRLILKAFPAEGYKFDRWIIDNKIYRRTPYQLIMNRNHRVIAVFLKEKPQDHFHFLTMATRGKGKTVPRSFTKPHKFKVNTKLAIRAIPDDGYRFDRWIRNGRFLNSVPKISIVMDRNYLFEAIFIKETGIGKGKGKGTKPSKQRESSIFVCSLPKTLIFKPGQNTLTFMIANRGGGKTGKIVWDAHAIPSSMIKIIPRKGKLYAHTDKTLTIKINRAAIPKKKKRASGAIGVHARKGARGRFSARVRILS